MDTLDEKNRPTGVVLSCTYYLISVAYSLCALLLIYFKVIPLNEEIKIYFSHLSWFDHFLSFSIGGSGLIGAFYLYHLKKIAVKFFGLALGLNIVSVLWGLVQGDLLQVMGISGALGIAFGIGIVYLIFRYSQRLEKRGRLE